MVRLPPPDKHKPELKTSELLVSLIQNYAPLITIALVLYGLNELTPIFSNDIPQLSGQSTVALRAIVAVLVFDALVVYVMWWAVGGYTQSIRSFVRETFSDKYRYSERNMVLSLVGLFSAIFLAVSIFLFFIGL